LYDILHDCKSPDQCKTLLCPNGTCWSPNPLLTMKTVDQDLMESHGLVDTVYSIEVEVIIFCLISNKYFLNGLLVMALVARLLPMCMVRWIIFA
jgi:hypothetical protein